METARDAAGKTISVLRERAKPVSDWADSKIVDKARAKKILIIALVIGLCFVFAGLAGKVCMDKATDSVKKAEFISGLGIGADTLLNRSAGKAMTRLLVSLIKNDSSGFVNAIKQILKVASSMAGDSYGMNGLGSMLISSIAEEAFAEERNRMIQEAGVYWPLLQAMAYYQELLTTGIIIALAAAILWFLLGGKLADIKELRMKPVLYIGAAWVVLVMVITVLGLTGFNIQV